MELIECECLMCRNIFFVPDYGELLDRWGENYPEYCPFCGEWFNVAVEEE